MKQYAEHNRVGVCKALRGDDMYFRTFSGGYPYINDGVLTRSSIATPIHSYGKNYEKYGERFALFVWTTKDSTTEIAELFDSLLHLVTKDKLPQSSSDSSFKYIT